MIRPLRQRHRRTFFALGIFLPVAFVFGIFARRPLPEVRCCCQKKSRPPQLHSPRKSGRARICFPNHPCKSGCCAKHRERENLPWHFSPPKIFVKPDLLIYWADGYANATNALPDNAILLGAFNSLRLPLPAAAGKTAGALVLFSLADNEIVDVSKPIRINASSQ